VQSQSVGWGGLLPSGVETSRRVGPTRMPRDARASERKVDRSWSRCCWESLYFLFTDEDPPSCLGLMEDPPRGIFHGTTVLLLILILTVLLLILFRRRFEIPNG